MIDADVDSDARADSDAGAVVDAGTIAVLIVVLIVVFRVVLYESYAIYLSAVLEYLSTEILGKPCWLSLSCRT